MRSKHCGENFPQCAPRRRAAFTLIESLIAVGIVGFAVAAVAVALQAGTNQNYLSVRYTVAVSLAEALLDEILTKPFFDPDTPELLTPGPEGGESARSLFDNVDDYDGLVEPAGGLTGPFGTALNDPSLAAFSRSASAQYIYLPGQDTHADPTFILVTVRVYDHGALRATLKRLISSVEFTITNTNTGA